MAAASSLHAPMERLCRKQNDPKETREMRKQIALIAMAAAVALPVIAQTASDAVVHGTELKRAHRVEIDSVMILDGEKVRVIATLTYANDTKTKCTYVMSASVLKQDAGAGIWLAPFPNSEKCVAVN